MRSKTAVHRHRTEGTATERHAQRAFAQVRVAVVGLAGLEPAASSLSEMDGQALCYPAFPLVVPLRKSYRDGVNLPIQVQPSVLAYPIRVVQSGTGEPLAHGAS